MIRERLGARGPRAGVGYFKFNTRGHDVVAGRGRGPGRRGVRAVPRLRRSISAR